MPVTLEQQEREQVLCVVHRACRLGFPHGPGWTGQPVLAAPAAYDFASWRTSGMTDSKRPVPQREVPPNPAIRRDARTGPSTRQQPTWFSYLMCGGYGWVKRHGS
ncbi:hypothetical protein GCM10023205_04560 [Yinghuangia aomiensis]|uniref:Transposase n=1 Tax=Yinghuangia aomiensis TaxID=676205 RepID=A0ABP9GLU2_9ACTN